MSEDYKEHIGDSFRYYGGMMQFGKVQGLPRQSGHLFRPEDLIRKGAEQAIQRLTVKPIPLSERKPGPEDLKNGQAWYGQPQPFGDQDTWDWCYTKPVHGEGSSFTHWLPAYIDYLPARVQS
jgi:hypothetical protein